MSSTSTLHIDLRVGESLQIGETTVTLEKKDGQRSRLVIQAPRTMPIRRPNQQPSAQECASLPKPA